MFQLNTARERRAVLAVFDVFCYLAICVLFYGAVKMRPMGDDLILREYLIDAGILLACIFGFRWFVYRIYHNIWRYTSTMAYLKIVLADFSAAVVTVGICCALHIFAGFVVMANLTCFTALATLCSRFIYRLIYKKQNTDSEDNGSRTRVAIVGAGQIGAILASDLMCSKTSRYIPMFFIDRDEEKIRNTVNGLTVYPEDDRIYDRIRAQGIKEIFVALGELNTEKADAIFRFYEKTGCRLKVYDTPVREATENGMPKRTIREFRIEDLLFREQASFADEETVRFYAGKTVLVTGGGGSIGSEICRQVARCGPAQLIIFDIYENNAYDIQQELGRRYGDKLRLSVEIGSVRDRERLESVFRYYRPDIVFHAAAHKHVPLMEHSGCEAIKNNVLGTFNTADMAEKYGVGKFILISTDKAVNPTNIMGASKRLCEMVIQCRTDSATSFAAVRFGNVLGSNGSVIPLFKRQIAAGGPVTITDKRIIRYFMTIPEASQLVMTAGAMARKGELFVLDMGKPVRIYDLAENMIRLSGFEPNVDIEIQEIGLRPGEKLFEELLMKNEALDKTPNNMIFIERDAPLSRDEVAKKLDILCAAVREAKDDIASPKIKEAIRRTVPTFHDPEEVNRTAEKTEEMRSTQTV